MHPLDNVIWCALTTRQAQLGEHNRSAAKFDKEVSVLGGLAEPGLEGYAAMAALLAVGDRVGLFQDEAVATPNFEVVSAVPLLQMVLDDSVAPVTAGAAADHELIPLTAADVPEMIALTELTQPGPFNARTRELGEYHGIRSHGRLIAMAGGRLQVPGYSEISAVCTHPDHLGRGLATALMALLIGRLRARGEQPFLHVRTQNNERAVALYERLGFHRRSVRRYVVLRRVA